MEYYLYLETEICLQRSKWLAPLLVLQSLAAECQKSKVSHLEAMANGLISKLEAIHGTSFKLTSLNSSVGFTNASGGNQQQASSTIPSSTSMDEMKQKVGKLFHGGQQRFWKKWFLLGKKTLEIIEVNSQ